jgi:hypothetical protein
MAGDSGMTQSDEAARWLFRRAPWKSTIEAFASATESLRTLRALKAQETCIQDEKVDSDAHSPQQGDGNEYQ